MHLTCSPIPEHLVNEFHVVQQYFQRGNFKLGFEARQKWLNLIGYESWTFTEKQLFLINLNIERLINITLAARSQGPTPPSKENIRDSLRHHNG
ncbi:hypothetical protein TSTA_054380 [Talaromyces stipitatus ATCC 10500]|uniref:Uncharacterized protein n=1 Tax=Talaromyces stipitatus (strain ATCC 10500 / CBS 375.48 / QM 6759 / NRRL 1006) TaxID=441959 RepID=B8MR32_TALSN|nr:uncharacterized protein TSTA_054380 [Talaromyces stipitatus ATCC 10500]EED12927.1 hypothetical protein TSTA_054380 [Talaromyces stipitatus ATCC 10500]